MKTINLDAFELDEFGRARLSDHDLQLIDDLGRVSLSGGDGVNDQCTGSNTQCNNQIKCDGSSNSSYCSNAGSCNTTLNKTRCANTGDIPEEVEL